MHAVGAASALCWRPPPLLLPLSPLCVLALQLSPCARSNSFAFASQNPNFSRWRVLRAQICGASCPLERPSPPDDNQQHCFKYSELGQ